MDNLPPVDRDIFQEEIAQQFTIDLLFRLDKTPDEVVEEFGEKHAGVLAWLGRERQDEILKIGMDADLSHWLNDDDRKKLE